MQPAAELQTQIELFYTRQGRFRLWLSQQARRAGQTWRLFSMNRLAVFGVVLIVLYALMSIAHPVLMATVWTKGVYDPQVGYDLQIFAHPSPPSASHLLGTDTLGRDVFSRLLAATTPTFILALTAALVTAAASTLSGAFSVYFGGILETIQTHLSDVFLLVPAPLLMVVIGGTIEISPLVFGLIYGLIAGLGGAAVIMRAQALSFIHKPYIEASRVAGAGGQQVIFKHLIPNMLPLATVQMLVSVTGAVFADGFSTFLGLSRTRLNWGSMIYDSFTYQAVNAAITWNVLIPSALAISLFAAAFYMIARGVHEVADPRLRAGEAAPAAKKVKTPKSARMDRPAPEMPVSSEAVAQATLEDTAPVRLARPSPLHLDDPAAFAWLEFLAARQGVVEGLLLASDERRPSPPEWVHTAGIYAPTSSQAATPAEETAQAGLAQARQSLQQGATAQAVAHYQRLIQARLLLPEIVQDLSQALEHCPAELSLWQALGDAHLRRGNLQLALEAYRKAERLIK